MTLLKQMGISLPADRIARIQEKLEDAEVEKYLRVNKDTIMKEMGIKTKEEYEEYIKGVLISLQLYREYEPGIEAFNKMTFNQKLDKYPMLEGNPQTDFLFLIQLDGYCYEQRKAILKVMKRDGRIESKKAFR